MISPVSGFLFLKSLLFQGNFKEIWANSGYRKLEFREIRLQVPLGFHSTILYNSMNSTFYLHFGDMEELGRGKGTCAFS